MLPMGSDIMYQDARRWWPVPPLHLRKKYSSAFRNASRMNVTDRYRNLDLLIVAVNADCRFHAQLRAV
jgi:hypothetical protein